jgi:predicted Zn-dependent protease
MNTDSGRRLKWIILLVAVGGIVALWLGPGQSAYLRHKQNSRLALARKFLNTGDYLNAILATRQVLLLNSSNVGACQVMAEIADLSQSPATLDWRHRVVDTEPTLENKLKLAEAGLRYQSRPFPLTTQTLQELSTNATTNAYYHVVAAERALVLRQFDLSHQEWSTAIKLAPTNRLYQMNLAAVELSSKDTNRLTTARTQLKSFLGDTNYAPVALRMLITDRLAHNDADGAFKFSQQLTNFSGSTLSDKLQHLSISKRNSVPNYSTQLAGLQQSATNAPMVIQVALWMQANDLGNPALLWITKLPASLRNQPPVKLIQADILELTQDWLSLRRFCIHGNWDDLDFLRLAFLSRAWAQLGDDSVAKSNWHAAMDSGSSRFGSLVGLLELTLRWRLMVERQELFWALLDKFPRERWVSAALEQQCHKTGDTAGLRRIYQQLMPTFPDDAGFKNNYCYTTLLLRKNQLEAETIAAKLHAQSPDDAPIASTYAFALHLRGRDAQAMDVMKKLPRATLEKPELALHYGILLQAAGHKAEAKPFLAIARTGANLLPEEKTLLDQATAVE